MNSTISGRDIEGPTDDIPDSYSFTDQTDIVLSTVTPSNIIQITGLSLGADISINSGTSPEYRICADGTCSGSPAFTSMVGTGTLNNNDYVQVRHTSSGSNVTLSTTSLTIGGITAGFSITTKSLTPTGFTKISKASSKLAYDYYIMTYEASLESGAFGADSISSIESDLAKCAYEFHVNQDAFNSSSCGTKASTAIPTSVQSATAIVNVSWHQAFAACRNMSNATHMMRLATSEEWQRAALWTADDYNAMWTVYTGVVPGTDCRTTSAADLTGASTACQSSAGVYDMAGNVSEWVDDRMLRYNIATNLEERFDFGPTIGRTLENGTDQISRRFHKLDPGVGGLALALGANFETPALADRKQYGANVQSWKDPTINSAGVGFRCVAFAKTQMPTVAQLTLPSEPIFGDADLPVGNPLNWKIPENLYKKDTKIEEIAITVNGNTTDGVAEGEIVITWVPWSKDVCNDANCSAPVTFDNFTYKIYRYQEPTNKSIRLSPNWALTGAPYSADEAIDPLLATSNNNLIATITNCDSSGPINCTFTDSISAGTGFLTERLYRYLVLATDNEGNSIQAMTQRFRSPYFVGDPAVVGAPSFRTEPRYRHASIFLVDEAHQQAKAVPQIMVHVPMDKSGLDHDFYIHKYEGALESGIISSTLSTGIHPEGAMNGGTNWIKEAAECYSNFLIIGGDISACGSNLTTATIKSGQGEAPINNIDQGASWRACMNTSFSDVDGNAYFLNLPTTSEWTKAADWGDVDLDGDIDQHKSPGHLGLSIATLEGGIADSTTVRCHTDGDPATFYMTNSAATSNCRSRYDLADHIGNFWEIVAERQYSGEGLDNGIDGLILTHQIKQTNGPNSTPTGFDLLRGTWPLAKAEGANLDHSGSSGRNGDYFQYTGGSLGMFLRGGYRTSGTRAGRWFIDVEDLPTKTNVIVSFRCGSSF